MGAPSSWHLENPPASAAHDCFQVYQRELNYLIGSLRRLGVAYSDIEDALHEVFVVMLTRWDHYDRARPMRPWLFGMALRVASARRRKNTRELLGNEHDLADWRPGPDEDLVARQGRALLSNALARVPVERRVVLIMNEIDGRSMRDIAQSLGIPLFTAYSRLRKARQELDIALLRVPNGRRSHGR